VSHRRDGRGGETYLEVEKIMAENQNLAQLKGYGVTIPVRIDLRAESGEAAIGEAVAAVQRALKSNQYDFNIDGDQTKRTSRE
jgi:hypothetical protein